MTTPKQLRLLQAGLAEVRSTVSQQSAILSHFHVDRPPICGPTSGPHRLTIQAPFDDETVFNLGHGKPEGGPGTRHIKDNGITGRTKSHVHFHTVDGKVQTMAALGGPTQEGFAGFNKQNVLGCMGGYAMVTTQSSWQDAEGQFVGIAQKEDLLLHAAGANKLAVLQAPAGSAFLSAGMDAVVAANKAVYIGADVEFPKENPVYNHSFHDNHINYTLERHSKIGAAIAKAAVFLIADAYKLKFPTQYAHHGHSEWGEAHADTSEVARLAVDVAAIVASMTGSEKGKVTVAADSDLGMYAGWNFAAYGAATASIYSLMSSNLFAGAYAAVKSLGWTIVAAGHTAAVKAWKVAKLEAMGPTGKAKVFGKEAAYVCSEAGYVAVRGKTSVDVTSDEYVGIHGSKFFYAGVGESSGWGIEADLGKIQLGRIASDAKNVSRPSMDHEKTIKILEDRMILQHGSTARLEIGEGDINLMAKRSTGFHVTDNLELKGIKILIG